MLCSVSESPHSFEYTIDITPGPASELGMTSVLYKEGDENICNGNSGGGNTRQSLSHPVEHSIPFSCYLMD